MDDSPWPSLGIIFGFIVVAGLVAAVVGGNMEKRLLMREAVDRGCAVHNSQTGIWEWVEHE